MIHPSSALLRAGLFLWWATQAAHAATVAHYRFEDGQPNSALPTTTRPGVIDSSINGHHLHAYRNPTVSASVPDIVVPWTSALNTRSVHFTGEEDIYSLPGEGLSGVVFIQFTVEAWVKFDTLQNWHTLVGRDSPGKDQGPGALFYLSKTTHAKAALGLLENAFRVELVTRSNRRLTVDSDIRAEPDVWYHVAAVGDTTNDTLSLYVDGRLVGTSTGFDGLFAPAVPTAWTIGRGQYAGKQVDRLVGCIDEVRFSDTALHPSRFLNATPPPPPPTPRPDAIPPSPVPTPPAPEPAPKAGGFWSWWP